MYLSIETVFFEATDRRKATKALHHKKGIVYSSPNLAELRAMTHFLSPKTSIPATNNLDEIIALCKIVSHVIDLIVVTIGAKGVVTAKHSVRSHTCSEILVVNHYPVEALSQVESVSGAGDCFASGFIHGMLLGLSEPHNVFVGFEAAKQALFCKTTIPHDLSVTHSMKKAKFLTYKLNF